MHKLKFWFPIAVVLFAALLVQLHKAASMLTKSDPFVLVWNDPRDAQLISWQI